MQPVFYKIAYVTGDFISSEAASSSCTLGCLGENCCKRTKKSFDSCASDNSKKGSLIVCESGSCNTVNPNLQESCGTGCCLPGQGGSTCVNSGNLQNIDNEPNFELCYNPNVIGEWKGANCSGTSCVDDPNEQGSYNCVSDAQCSSLNPGQCGEFKCISNQCVTQARTDAQTVCQGIASSVGYECSYYAGCTKQSPTSTQWQCQFGGAGSLCSNPDIGCSGAPTYKCNVALCSSGSSCALCYSQCLIAANDPDRAPSSAQECPKNGLWTQCGGA